LSVAFAINSEKTYGGEISHADACCDYTWAGSDVDRVIIGSKTTF